MKSAINYSFNRPGTLTLRSDNGMRYGPKVLNDEWYEAAQANPKDYDIYAAEPENRNCFISTYRFLGSSPETVWRSANREAMEECLTWPKTTQEVHRPGMVNIGNFVDTLVGDKDCLAKYSSLRQLMQRHRIDGDPNPQSTYTRDFPPPVRLGKPMKETPNWDPPSPPWFLHRKCCSQFTDIGVAGRGPKGMVKFRDESGVYLNSYLKKQHRHSINPITNVPCV